VTIRAWCGECGKFLENGRRTL